MGVITDVAVSQDGFRSCFLRDRTGGTVAGQYRGIMGPESYSASREVTERELLGGNATYKSDSKFKKYSGSLTYWGIPPSMMEYMIGCKVIVVGEHVVVKEVSTMTPKPFEMYLQSDGEGEDGETAAVGERYLNCKVKNWNNPKKSGDYVSFDAVVEAFEDSNFEPRHLIFAGDGTPFDITLGETPPAAPVIVPADEAIGFSISGTPTITYAVDMADASKTLIKLYKDSDGSLVATTNTVVGGAYTVTPDASLDAATLYNLYVHPSVETDAGVKIGVGIATQFTTA